MGPLRLPCWAGIRGGGPFWPVVPVPKKHREGKITILGSKMKLPKSIEDHIRDIYQAMRDHETVPQ